ncbi:MAG: glycosyltransferase family 4 protein [bacterium]
MHVAMIEFRTSTPYPVQLANALGPLCQVTLLLPDGATAFADYVDQDHVALQRFSMPRLRELANLGMVWHLRRLLNAVQPDVLHITFWHLWGTPGLRMLARYPVVATVHDVSRHPGERGIWAIPSTLYRWQWRGAGQIIVHADSARQQLLHRDGRRPESVHVIPIGTYDFYRSFADTSQLERPNTILFFGRIWGYKGLMHLIQAEPRITQAIPDARIVIAGEGEDFREYRRAMVNPANFQVHNYRIPDEEVPELFQSASIVVLPYMEASQSGVIPLAYAFGKPVIATRVGGIPDIVDHGITGLLVPPADPDRLADAIVELLKDQEARREMGRRAKEKGENELSWASVAERTLRVYEKARSVPAAPAESEVIE